MAAHSRPVLGSTLRLCLKEGLASDGTLLCPMAVPPPIPQTVESVRGGGTLCVWLTPVYSARAGVDQVSFLFVCLRHFSP